MFSLSLHPEYKFIYKWEYPSVLQDWICPIHSPIHSCIPSLSGHLSIDCALYSQLLLIVANIKLKEWNDQKHYRNNDPWTGSCEYGWNYLKQSCNPGWCQWLLENYPTKTNRPGPLSHKTKAKQSVRRPWVFPAYSLLKQGIPSRFQTDN